MFGKLSIKGRLLLFVVAVGGIQVAFSTFIFNQLVSIEHHVKGIAHRDMPIIKAITAVTEHQLEQEILFEKAFRHALEVGKEPGAEKHFIDSVESFNKLDQRVNDEIRLSEQLVAEAVASASSPQDAEVLSSMEEQLLTLEQHHAAWGKHAQGVFALLEQQEFHEAEVVTVDVEAEAGQLIREVEHLLEEIEQFTEQAVIDVEHEAQWLERMSVLATLLALLVAGALAWLTLRSIQRGLDKGKNALQILAEGDFQQPVKADEPAEIGELLAYMESMRTRVGELMCMVNASTEELSGAAQSLAHTSAEVQQNVQTQTTELEMVATAVEEMSSTAQEVANSAASTQTATSESTQRSTESQQANQDARTHTQQLVQSLDASGEAIAELEKNSQNIGAVLDVIKSIAEQTNLLALNAAIEAARAGEQGRGFAVVADEVRHLAQRTQESTVEIESMIEQFREGAHDAMRSMQQSRELGGKTITFAEHSSELMDLVDAAIASVNDMNMQIASAAEQQSGVVEEINRNVVRVNDAAERNSLQVEQTAAASEELATTTQTLKAAVARFRLPA